MFIEKLHFFLENMFFPFFDTENIKLQKIFGPSVQSLDEMYVFFIPEQFSFSTRRLIGSTATGTLLLRHYVSSWGFPKAAGKRFSENL